MSHDQVYHAIISHNEYIILNTIATTYNPSTLEYIDTCKNIGSKLICKQRYPDYLINETETCESLIIRKTMKELEDGKCETKLFLIDSSIYIQLNNNQIIVINPKEIRLNFLCKDHHQEFSHWIAFNRSRRKMHSKVRKYTYQNLQKY